MKNVLPSVKGRKAFGIKAKNSDDLATVSFLHRYKKLQNQVKLSECKITNYKTEKERKSTNERKSKS